MPDSPAIRQKPVGPWNKSKKQNRSLLVLWTSSRA